MLLTDVSEQASLTIVKLSQYTLLMMFPHSCKDALKDIKTPTSRTANTNAVAMRMTTFLDVISVLYCSGKQIARYLS